MKTSSTFCYFIYLEQIREIYMPYHRHKCQPLVKTFGAVPKFYFQIVVIPLQKPALIVHLGRLLSTI